MKRFVSITVSVILLLLCILCATSCGTSSFTVKMSEAEGKAEAITLTVTLDSTTYGNVDFSVDGKPCTVVQQPTVTAPIYMMEAEDGGSISLSLDVYSPYAELHAASTDGTVLVYTAPIKEFKKLTDWLGID